MPLPSFVSRTCPIALVVSLAAPVLAQPAPVPPQPPPPPGAAPPAPPPSDKDAAKAEAARQKKEKAEAKAREKEQKKLEREAKEKAKKEEEKAKKEAERAKKQKEKEEKERKKRGLPEPAPEPPPPPPAPPPPPPPPPPKPKATPVESVGTARWTNIGFVQPGEAPTSNAPSAGAVKVPSVVDETDLTLGYMRFGGSRARFNPINDGKTDDTTAFGMGELDIGGGVEFRHAGALLVPWFDVDIGILGGKRKDERNTDYEFSVFSTRVSGLFGIDLAPVQYVQAGPEVGYRMEMYSVSYGSSTSTSSSSSSSSSAEAAIMNGLQYGVHVRARTKATAKEPSVFFVDGRYEWRTGKYQTANYAVLQAAIRAGVVYFTAWYETRLGSSGAFTQKDVLDTSIPPNQNKSLANATAAAIPVDQRLGGGIMVAFF